MSKSFNQNHPELREGELFLVNGQVENLEETAWKSKRPGTQAYTRDGKRFGTEHGFFPIFVSREELYAKDPALIVRLTNR